MFLTPLPFLSPLLFFLLHLFHLSYIYLFQLLFSEINDDSEFMTSVKDIAIGEEYLINEVFTFWLPSYLIIGSPIKLVPYAGRLLLIEPFYFWFGLFIGFTYDYIKRLYMIICKKET